MNPLKMKNNKSYYNDMTYLVRTFFYVRVRGVNPDHIAIHRWSGLEVILLVT